MKCSSIIRCAAFGLVLSVGLGGCGDGDEAKEDSAASVEAGDGGTADADGGAGSGGDVGLDDGDAPGGDVGGGVDGGDEDADGTSLDGLDADADGSDDTADGSDDGGADTASETGGDSGTGGDDGSDVDPSAMRIGEELEIALESNPSTGYSWAVQSPTDDAVLELVSTDFIEPDAPDGMAGVPGTEVFSFRATGVGSVTVLLHYVRSWEPDAPADTHSQDVTVIE